MALFLILGVVLGAAAIIFILQNITPITVVFFTYQLNGSLALILFLTLFTGMVVTILILLPGFIRDAFAVRRLRKQNKDLEDQLRDAQNNYEALKTHTNLNVNQPVV